MSLAFLAFSCESLAIINHCWPVVTVAFYFDCEGFSAGVIFARFGMDFVHDCPCFIFFYARHKWSEDSPFVDFSVYENVSRGLGLDFPDIPFF